MKFICYESFNLNHITIKVKFKKRITDNLKGIKEKKRKEKKRRSYIRTSSMAATNRRKIESFSAISKGKQDIKLMNRNAYPSQTTSRI